MRFMVQVLFVAACVFCSANHTLAQSMSQRLKAEPAADLAAAAREKGSAVRGAILFPQRKLGCANCHVAGNDQLTGPDLTRLTDAPTDEQLVDAILRPSKTIRKGFETVTVLTIAGKSIAGRVLRRNDVSIVLRDLSPEQNSVEIKVEQVYEIVPNTVSGMPDHLADQLNDRQQFLDLVRYVMEITATDARPSSTTHHSPGGELIDRDLQGLVLLKEFNCGACHADNVSKALVSANSAPDLTWLNGRMSPSYLQKFLLDPHGVRHATRMPNVLDRLQPEKRRDAAEALTHFVMSLRNQPFERQPIEAAAAVRGRELFHTIGCVACHAPRDENEAVPQTIQANARKRSVVTPKTRLNFDVFPYLNAAVPLATVREKYNLTGLVDFLKDPHASRSTGRMPNMKLTHWEALDVAQYLLKNAASQVDANSPINFDAKLAADGRALFQKLDCVNCHSLSGLRKDSTAPALADVDPTLGCLSGSEGQWPHYRFTISEREALRSVLAKPARQLSDADQIAISLTAFRCLNCHQRDELGGVSAERNPHFQTTNPNLGPQGRIPPTLTGVGAKLKPRWLRQVLVSGRAIRPYQKTRMPLFGTSNVEHLIDLFQKVDRVPEIRFAAFKDQKAMRTAGFEMAGTAGLNCIACHTFQMKQAATMPGVDLTEMSERLQQNWFYRYMKDPQRLSLNTVMPSFWPGGRAIRKDILDGDPDQQIEALWQYLLDGRQARSPKGLIHEPMELLATDEAVMLRRSYRGIGKRGIGVGYPGQVNLAYDAEQLRLAILWPGKFADPGGVWRSQGHGTVRPLDRRQTHFARGPDLDDADAPWIVDDGRPPRHRFKGYALDDKQRPRFEYVFDGINVQDYFVDVIDGASEKPFLRRTLTLQTDSARAGVAFRAATGKRIVEAGDNAFRVDGSMTVRIDQTHTAEVVDASDGRQLRIRLDVAKGNSQLVVEYVW